MNTKYLFDDESNVEIINNDVHVYLNVPFKEKDQAKKQGAKYDPKYKKWYCNDDNKTLIDKYGIEQEVKEEVKQIIISDEERAKTIKKVKIQSENMELNKIYNYKTKISLEPLYKYLKEKFNDKYTFTAQIKIKKIRYTCKDEFNDVVKIDKIIINTDSDNMNKLKLSIEYLEGTIDASYHAYALIYYPFGEMKIIPFGKKFARYEKGLLFKIKTYDDVQCDVKDMLIKIEDKINKKYNNYD